MFLFLNNPYIYSYILLVIILIVILYQLVCFLSIVPNYSTEKLTTYECGFIPFSDISNIIDISFCIVGIVFLLFDIEVLFLLPWAGIFTLTTQLGFFTMYIFYIIVSLSLYIEWDKGIFQNIGSL